MDGVFQELISIGPAVVSPHCQLILVIFYAVWTQIQKTLGNILIPRLISMQPQRGLTHGKKCKYDISGMPWTDYRQHFSEWPKPLFSSFDRCVIIYLTNVSPSLSFSFPGQERTFKPLMSAKFHHNLSFEISSSNLTLALNLQWIIFAWKYLDGNPVREKEREADGDKRRWKEERERENSLTDWCGPLVSVMTSSHTHWPLFSPISPYSARLNIVDEKRGCKGKIVSVGLHASSSNHRDVISTTGPMQWSVCPNMKF